jgi:hypothetical protein
VTDLAPLTSLDGRLTAKVLEYEKIMRKLMPAVKEPGFTLDGWAPLAELVAVDEFTRVGTWMEVMTWHEYIAFITRWAGKTVFETAVRRVSELPGTVYYEIEERHFRGENVTVVNSLTVFQFNADDKICRLDVYLQAPAAVSGAQPAAG